MSENLQESVECIPDLYDPLDAFAERYNNNCDLLHYVPLENAVTCKSGAWSVRMFLHEEFQVQMWVIPPNFIIPEHTHPNVDSYEVYVGGQIMFSHSGKWVVTESDLKSAGEDDLSPLRGEMIRVRPNDSHGGCFGPSGGVFLSIQHWLNGVRPTCVSNDYDGIGLDKNHKADFGNITYKKLTWKDAASLENEAPFWEN